MLKKMSLVDPGDVISKSEQRSITGGLRRWCTTYCWPDPEIYNYGIYGDQVPVEIISGEHCYCPRADYVAMVCDCD